MHANLPQAILIMQLFTSYTNVTTLKMEITSFATLVEETKNIRGQLE